MTADTVSPLVAAGTLLGGIGLFLLGMTMLTGGLKLAAGRALERVLATWTRTPLRGLVTGVSLTALMQSSTAMTVATIGFVNAGLLRFTAAVWVVFGSNLGSTVTGWLVALLGFSIKVDSFALPFIGIGMALNLIGGNTKRGALGQTVAGFGILFLGIDLLREGFMGLGPQTLPPLADNVSGWLLGMLIGLLMTIVLQASSATLALALTAVAGGSMTVESAGAIIIGANIGTTLTGILAALRATPNAKRLAAAHVLFNVVAAIVAFALLSPLLTAINVISVWLMGENHPVTQLVIFHTIFNALGVLLMWPLSPPLVRFLRRRFRSAEEDEARTRFIDSNVAAVPALALQALRREMERVGHLALRLSADAMRLTPHVLPWPPTPPQAEERLTLQVQTLERLLQQVGAFVSEVSRQALSQDVAEQMPELLRIATYYDTLAHVMHQIALQVLEARRQAPEQEQPTPLVSELSPVCAAALTFFAAADPQTGAPEETIDSAHAAFRAAYKEAKLILLRAGVQGELDVAAVHEWVGQLGDLRRAADQANKAATCLAALPPLVEASPENLLQEAQSG